MLFHVRMDVAIPHDLDPVAVSVVAPPALAPSVPDVLHPASRR